MGLQRLAITPCDWHRAPGTPFSSADAAREWRFGPGRLVDYGGPGHDLKVLLNEGMSLPLTPACPSARAHHLMCPPPLVCLVQVLGGFRQHWIAFGEIGKREFNGRCHRFVDLLADPTSPDHAVGPSLQLL